MEIKLTQGKTTVVDKQDKDLDQYKWRMGGSVDRPYAVREVSVNGERHTEHLHRVILERILGRPLLKKELVDHVNGLGTDNRRSNLRLCSQHENMRNTAIRSDNTSGYKGVSWNREKKKWNAYVNTFGKRYRLGYFSTLQEAVQARRAKAQELHGSFARES